MLSRVRMVLVSPAGSANVGAAARAMKNMGVSRLVVVSPGCDPRDAQARQFASNAQDTLQACRIAPDIPTALQGCICTFATTAREGLYRKQFCLSPEQAAEIALDHAAAGDVAFVFGPERTGLTNPELLHTDRVVTIPSDPGYPVLNLAASVLVIAYELRRAFARRRPQPPAGQGGNAQAREQLLEIAPDERKAAMFGHLFDALERIGFFAQQNPDHLKHALRHLLGRADLTVFECDILIGMARQIQARTDRRPPP